MTHAILTKPKMSRGGPVVSKGIEIARSVNVPLAPKKRRKSTHRSSNKSKNVKPKSIKALTVNQLSEHHSSSHDQSLSLGVMGKKVVKCAKLLSLARSQDDHEGQSDECGEGEEEDSITEGGEDLNNDLDEFSNNNNNNNEEEEDGTEDADAIEIDDDDDTENEDEIIQNSRNSSSCAGAIGNQKYAETITTINYNSNLMGSRLSEEVKQQQLSIPTKNSSLNKVYYQYQHSRESALGLSPSKKLVPVELFDCTPPAHSVILANRQIKSSSTGKNSIIHNRLPQMQECMPEKTGGDVIEVGNDDMGCWLDTHFNNESNIQYSSNDATVMGLMRMNQDETALQLRQMLAENNNQLLMSVPSPEASNYTI